MAHYSQTRIVGKVEGQFFNARWWLYRPIIDAHLLPQFGQAKVWNEDGRDAARSFCLLRFFFAALCGQTTVNRLEVIFIRICLKIAKKCWLYLDIFSCV